MMKSSNFLPEVKAQYEDLPYPPRNPEEEKYRLCKTYADNLIAVNHYCFGGEMDFRSDFRVLVAGGGTGDSLIYLAEQLREFDAEVVYLDMSEASRSVAQERARVRGLTNIQWHTGSLLDLPDMGLGEFDYINCCGVLHHLESTEQGLLALRSVLKPNGSIMLMLYGKYGRRVVYDMQSLLREYLPAEADYDEKIKLTRELLAALPETNSFKINWQRWQAEFSAQGMGDSGLYDLLLHSQDRCFDVDELYLLAESSDLKLIDFAGLTKGYDAYSLVSNSSVKAQLDGFNLKKRRALAEQFSCSQITHEFYLSMQGKRRARLDNLNLCPVLIGNLYGKHGDIAAEMLPEKPIRFTESAGGSFAINGSAIAKVILASMDGNTPISRIIKRVKKQVPGSKAADIKAELQRLYDALHPRAYLYLIKEGAMGVTVPKPV